MYPSGSGTTWLSVLEEKKHQIKEDFGKGYIVLGNVSGDRSFRSAFETLSRKKGEYRPSRLEAKLLPSYGPIVELARAVDQSIGDLQHLAPDETLESLVWGISYALIDVSRPVPKTTPDLPNHSGDAELGPSLFLL